jgi:hypothetical protein
MHDEIHRAPTRAGRPVHTLRGGAARATNVLEFRRPQGRPAIGQPAPARHAPTPFIGWTMIAWLLAGWTAAAIRVHDAAAGHEVFGVQSTCAFMFAIAMPWAAYRLIGGAISELWLRRLSARSE